MFRYPIHVLVRKYFYTYENIVLDLVMVNSNSGVPKEASVCAKGSSGLEHGMKTFRLEKGI